MTAVNAVGVPWLRLFYRTEEHLVQTQCVSTVFLYYHVGIDDVEHRLRHLLNSPSAYILSVFQYKFGIVVFRSPCLEGIDVENVVLHDVDINVYWSSLVLVFQTCRHEYGSLGVVVAVYAIYKVGAALYHTLVYEFLEWLFLAAHSVVEEELVPEAGVYKVTSGMLGSTYVEVNVLPVFVYVLSHESIVVLRVHISQVVCGATCKARHGEQFQWEDGIIVYELLVNDLVLLSVPSPYLCPSQRWFASLCRLILVYLGKLKRQTLLRYHVRHAVLVIHRERLSPVTLT